jgi:ribosomal protein S18 acetylase RimI-like enzyme
MRFWRRRSAGATESGRSDAIHSSESDVAIRAFSRGDTKSVIDLWANHFFVEVHGRTPSRRDLATFSDHLNGSEPSTIWVATCQGRVVGFLGLTPPETNEGDAPIHGLAVHRAFRRRRVASKLFSTALDALKQNPATSWISISDMSNGSYVGRMAQRAGFSPLRGSTYVLSLHGLDYRW